MIHVQDANKLKFWLATCIQESNQLINYGVMNTSIERSRTSIVEYDTS